MPDIKRNTEKVYNALQSRGVKGIGDNAEQFGKLLEKEENRQKVYDALTKRGIKGIGKDFNEFSSLVYDGGSTQQPSTEATTAPQADASPEPTPAPVPETPQATVPQETQPVKTEDTPLSQADKDKYLGKPTLDEMWLGAGLIKRQAEETMKRAAEDAENPKLARYRQLQDKAMSDKMLSSEESRELKQLYKDTDVNPTAQLDEAMARRRFNESPQGQFVSLSKKMAKLDKKSDEYKALEEQWVNNPYYKQVTDGLKQTAEQVYNDVRSQLGMDENAYKLWFQNLIRRQAMMKGKVSPINTALDKQASTMRMMREAIKILNDPSKYSESNWLQRRGGFAKTFGKEITDLSMWLKDFTSGDDAVALRSVFQKVADKFGKVSEEMVTGDEINGILDQDEQNLLKAYFLLTEAQSMRPDVAGYVRAGRSAAESAKFIIEMAISGEGIGFNSLEKGLTDAGAKRAAERALGKWAKKAIAGGGWEAIGAKALSATARLGDKVLVNALVSAPAVIFHPSLWGNMARSMGQLDDKGKPVEVSNKLMLDAWFDAWKERFTEGLGESVFSEFLGAAARGAGIIGRKALGKGLAGKAADELVYRFEDVVDWMNKTKPAQIVKQAANSSLGQAARQIGKASRFDGILGEMGEEGFGAAIDALRQGSAEPLRDFFTWENLLITGESFLPMYVFGGGMSAAGLAANRVNYGLSERKLSRIMQKYGYTEDQVNYLVQQTKGASIDEIGTLLGKVGANITNSRFGAAGQVMLDNEQADIVRTFREFLEDSVTANMYGEMENERQAQMRESVRQEMEQRLGGKFYIDGKNGKPAMVQTARVMKSDGTTDNVFILGEANKETGEYPVVYPDGTHDFLQSQDVVARRNEEGKPVLVGKGVLAVDAQSQPLDAFLSAEVMRREGASEAQINANKINRVNGDLRPAIEAIKDEATFHGKKGTLSNFTETGATFSPEDDSAEQEVVSYVELAKENGIVDDSPMPTDQEEQQAEGVTMAQAVAARRELGRKLNDAVMNFFTINVDGEDMLLRYVLPGSINPQTGMATGVFLNPQGGARAFDFNYRSLLEPEVAEAPVEKEPVVEAEENTEPEIKETRDYYQGRGSSVETMLGDLYGNEYLQAEEVDREIMKEYERAKKARNEAKMALDAAKPENIKQEEGESLPALAARRKEAKEKYDSVRDGLEKQLQEAEDELAFWAQAKELVDEDIAERKEDEKREKKRQADIAKYGVDISTLHDLDTPLTLEEAVAEYLGNSTHLINAADAEKEWLGKGNPNAGEIFRHRGPHGILTLNGGQTVRAVAEDIVGEYDELKLDEQKVFDEILNQLDTHTKSEMKDVIFQNRLKEAVAAKEAAENAPAAENAVEEASEGTEVPEAEVPESEPAEEGETTVEEQIEGAREDVDTHPTEGQKEAGNYKKGHVTIDGMDISIENPKGSIRSGKDSNGNEWKVTMNNDYGYIRLTEGVDGDHIDIFLSDKPSEGRVFVVDQVNEDGSFDEHKVMYGFNSIDEAREAYLANYSPGWKGLGAITEVSKEEFKKWIDSSHRKTKPFSEYKSVKAEETQSETPENKPQSGRNSGGKSVTSQGEKGKEAGVPATAKDIKTKEQAQAYFEGLYGKGKRADNSVRVWELMHKKKSSPKQDEDGMVSQMAMSLANDTGLSDEEAAELVTLGTQLAEDYITEDGLVRFPQFFKNLVETFGDGIRPFAKSIYLGASATVSDELADQMDDRKAVRAFDENIDLNDISDEQEPISDVQQEPGGVSGTVADTPGEGVQGEPDNGTDTGASAEDSGSGETPVGELDGGNDSGTDSGSGEPGANGTSGRGGRGRRKADDGSGTPKNSGRNRNAGQRENEPGEGAGRDTGRVEDTEAEKEARAKAQEDAAYEAEKERIKDETDTKKLKSLKDEIKAKLSSITDKYDEARAKLNGQLRAILEKLQQLFSNNANKSESLAQEKVPYASVSDPEGTHSIGSVVPSGAADYMRDAVKRLEAEVGKSVAEYVKDELGYKDLDEMFTKDGKDIGLSAEQVDAVGLAIHQMNTGRIFVVGDMTGVGKGRVGAALIRWAKKQGKKVVFCTEQPNLFTAMYNDIADIGGLDRKSAPDPVPWIIGNGKEANITDDNDGILVSTPSDNEVKSLYSSGKDELPVCPGGRNRGNIKGRQYDFVMTTYSQLQATEEEEEGDSEKVKKKNERNAKGRQRLDWLKKYATDAIVIMDESHTAAGQGSTRGENAKKLVEVAQGVTFMSATFAKTPQAMGLYAIRSSMNDAMITRDQLIAAIDRYGIPMQEILAAALFKTGEMVRRERDFEGVKTNWMAPEESYSKEEIQTTQSLSDKTVDVINAIIDFQRRYVDPVIDKLNKDKKAQNEAKLASGASDVYIEEYASTPYSGQVSNVIGMMLFALKAKKAADIAIEQIKKGEKPVIAVDNTLGAYVDQIEGNIDSADFGAVLMKGLAFALKYQLTTHHMKLTQLPSGFSVYKKVPGDRQVEKYESIEELLGAQAIEAMEALAEKITAYGKETLAMDLPLSPIDYIKKKIADAGYKCGEITKRQNALIQNPDGTWRKEAIKHNKKDVIKRFNGGSAANPLPKEETYDAVVMNRSGATGNSMHASRRFGDQRPRKMIILQAAKDPNNEVQIRGRIDRTGQVHRGEYFYIISPIPAEKKITMMLKQKLASLDANSVGSERVASNKVEAEDMDNKYGDEVARDFLVDHEEIHFQMDPAKQMKRDRKTGEYKGRPGLLYDLLLSMQRMTVADQETILTELEEAYAQKIEYLNQNGINDLATSTMNLDAVTIDSAIMIKGKDNDALSEFAHDTTIERVEVNVLRKPLRSEDIHKKSRELGVDEKHTKLDSQGEEEDVSYGEFIQQKARDAVDALKTEKKAKQEEAEKKMEADLRAQTPRPDGMTDEQYDQLIQNDPKLIGLKLRNANEYTRYEAQLQEQLQNTFYATHGLHPGWPYKIPLNESEGAESRYGRFIGFKTGKDGRPKSIEAVFATRDSRAMVSLPVVNMHKILETVVQTGGGFYDMFGKMKSDYGTEEGRMAAYDKWWDRMTPSNTSRSMRYMITGNILQAAGLLFAYRGTITTFTRKDAETGEVTVDKGLLLAEDFDPENFMVRTAVTKEDVWENPGEFSDDISNIAVYRDGNQLVVKFKKRGKEKLINHPVMNDDDFKALCEGELDMQTEQLVARVSEKNAADALDYLYRNYGFTQSHLLVMPDSTDKPDRIVYTNKPYKDVIESLKAKYRAYGSSSTQQKIDEALKEYRMDITNEELKTRIRELVQLRQAYLREDYALLDDSDLAWNVIIKEQEIEKLERPVPNESPEQALERRRRRDDARNLMEAYKEELYSRGFKKGTLKHFKQGKIDLDTIKKTFDEFNKDAENAKIAKKVFDIMKKLKVNIFLNEKTGNDTGGYTAGDLLSYNWRFMNEDWIPDQLKANTILHEMIHTATVYAVRAVEEGKDHVIPGLVDAANQAKSLFSAIYNNEVFRHQSGESSWNYYKDYGTKNAKEMLAELGANQTFRDNLAKVKVLIQPSFGQISFSDVTKSSSTPGGNVMSGLDAAMDILTRLLDNFNTDGYRKMWEGTGYGDISAPAYSQNGLHRRGQSVTENLRAPIDRANAIVAASNLAKSLGVKFKEDPALDGKGVFDPNTGQIRINIDNHDNTADLEATILHEAVAHYGLRKLFGKDWIALRKRLYEMASTEIKEKVDAIARENGLSAEVAMEEYIAQLAEDGRFDQQEESFWQKVVRALRVLLAKIGMRSDYLTDEDYRTLLYASYRNLQSRGALETAARVVTYNALRKSAELSHSENDDNGPEDDGPSGSRENPLNDDNASYDDIDTADDTDALYRKASAGLTAGTAADFYGNKVRTIGSALYEVTVDEYHPVDILSEAIEKESGLPIGDSERVSDHLREAGGKAMQAARDYDKNYLQPMWDAVGAFRSAIGEKGTAETERYISLKSGLERNIVLAQRDAKRDYEAEYKAVAGPAEADIRKVNVKEQKELEALEKKLDEGKISDVTYSNETARVKLEADAERKRLQDEIDLAAGVRDAHFKDIESGIDPRFLEYRKKDYSAITAWAETDDLEEAERLARDYVAYMESRAGADIADELWKRINAATKETLKFQYEHDMLTRQQYSDVAKMMKYYVPMRGFEDDTAEDLYNYYVTSQSNDFQATLLATKGRKTLFEGPLGNIGAMARSAISQGVKNQAKLSLLNVVRNRKRNSVATVTRAWFVSTGVKDASGKYIFEVAYPQIPEGADFATRQSIIEQFEQDMKAKYAKGEAYNAHRDVDLHGGVVAFEKDSHKNEHVVTVREGGREYGIIINGNPAAAQAINGVKRGNGNGEQILDMFRTWTRFLSQMFTTLSVPFWVSNFQRDFGQGLTNTAIRNDKSYVGRYLLNYARAFKVFPLLVTKDGLDKALASGDSVAKLYKEYLDNGGPMGQNRIEDNEYFERQMKRYLDGTQKGGIAKGANAVLNFIGGVGEAVETVTRFAVFMTSREAGRPIHECISDAKEVSTNFARKGSGRSLTKTELDRITHADGTKLSNAEKGFVKAVSIGVNICRASIPFFNAAVQGLENKRVNFRDNLGKTLIADAIYFMAGLGMSLLMGGAGGDDDKEKYSHTSDYLRRNNLLLPFGGGVFGKWALPQEYRVMFAMGDIVASGIKQERPIDDLAKDAFGALMQMSPVGVVTDEVLFSSNDPQKAAESLLLGVTPGVLDPVLESIFNRDFKGARLYNEGFNDNLRAYPGWTKAIPTTGKEYVALTKFLNNITGGNDVERGWINLNPAIVEHLVESYFSGPYQIVVRLPEAVGKAVTGDLKVRDIPLVNRIILNTNDNSRDAYYSNMYYYFKERNTEAARIFSEYKQRSGKEVDKFMKSDDFRYMLVFKQYESEEKAARKEGKRAEQEGNIEKKNEVDARIQKIHEEIARRCLDIYFDGKRVK